LAARGVLIALLLAALAAPAAAAQASEFYPCVQCHATLVPNATVSASSFHGINLSEGPHAGLYCVNCHVPESGMMLLRGGVPLAIPGVHNESSLFEVNKLCAQCHANIYELYQAGAHGNTTFTCEGGDTQVIIGYNGVKYYYHDCPPGSTYEPRPAQPCIACHNPHQPKMEPPSILPPPSDRPEPPPQDEILLGGVSTGVAGAALVLLAIALHRRGGGGG